MLSPLVSPEQRHRDLKVGDPRSDGDRNPLKSSQCQNLARIQVPDLPDGQWLTPCSQCRGPRFDPWSGS